MRSYRRHGVRIHAKDPDLGKQLMKLLFDALCATADILQFASARRARAVHAA